MSRYSDLQPVGMGAFGLVWYAAAPPPPHDVTIVVEHPTQQQQSTLLTLCFSSARDQLTNQNVAVKKIMKPFSTPVLAKRTYRELKLLKHLRHENVTEHASDGPDQILIEAFYRSFLSATFSFLPSKTCKRTTNLLSRFLLGFIPTTTVLTCPQLFRHRTPGNRSPQTAYLETTREAIYSIFFVPNHGIPTPYLSH